MNSGVVRADQAGREIPKVLRIFLRWSVLLAAICLVIEAFCHFVLHLHYPYNFPIFNPGSFGYDLMLVRSHFSYFHQKAFFEAPAPSPFVYPPTAALVYWFFYSFGRFTRPVFLAFSLMAVSVPAFLLGRRWTDYGVAPKAAATYLGTCFLVSYPLWFEFKLENIEIVVLAVIACGVWMLLREHMGAASVFFGIAVALKLFPIVYVGLLVARKRYSQAIFSMVIAGVLTLASLWAVCPSIGYSWRQSGQSIAWFRGYAMLHRLFPEAGFDHSLFGLLKSFVPHLPPEAAMSHWLNVYLCVVAVGGILLFFLRIRYLPALNQVLCLTIASILLPPISVDYTLIQLFVPWVMITMFVIRNEGKRVEGLALMLGCFVLEFAPLSEFIFGGRTIEGQIRAVVLVVLGWAALRYPLSPGEAAGTGMA